jgi:transmembrane sensor
MDSANTTVVRFPSRQKAREEASLWLARMDRGLGEAERREIGAWLEEDALHEEALLALATLWDQTAVLSELAELFPLERPSRRRRAVRAWALVGVVGACAVGALTFFGIASYDRAPGALLAYETAVGGQSTIDLLDGSKVTLNTDSAIEVRFTDTERTVTLTRGESYFAVEPDPERPFRVHANGRIFEAVGTAFNVRIGLANDVKMMVTEGRVGVLARAPGVVRDARNRPADAEAIVDAGNLAIVDDGGVAIQALDPVQIEAQLSWQQGMLIFDGEPLESVLLEMGRYTSTEISVDASLRDVRVGGYFRAGDVDGLLVALRENFDIEFTRTGDGRIILSASP